MKLLKMMTAVAATVFAVATGSAQANTNYDFDVSESLLKVNTTGEVLVTFLSKTAAYSNDLFVTGGDSVILNNQTAVSGQVFSLGNYVAGDTLSFSMFVNNTGHTYSMGNASLNPDNVKHVAYDKTQGQSLIVGFEDLYKGGDYDYDDLVFSVSNVTAMPEPETYAMLLLGIGLVAGFSRRK